MVDGIRVDRDSSDVFQIHEMDLGWDAIDREFDHASDQVKGDGKIENKKGSVMKKKIEKAVRKMI